MVDVTGAIAFKVTPARSSTLQPSRFGSLTPKPAWLHVALQAEQRDRAVALRVAAAGGGAFLAFGQG